MRTGVLIIDDATLDKPYSKLEIQRIITEIT